MGTCPPPRGNYATRGMVSYQGILQESSRCKQLAALSQLGHTEVKIAFFYLFWSTIATLVKFQFQIYLT